METITAWWHIFELIIVSTVKWEETREEKQVDSREGDKSFLLTEILRSLGETRITNCIYVIEDVSPKQDNTRDSLFRLY
jgi:hypothetical protein